MLSQLQVSRCKHKVSQLRYNIQVNCLKKKSVRLMRTSTWKVKYYLKQSLPSKQISLAANCCVGNEVLILQNFLLNKTVRCFGSLNGVSFKIKKVTKTFPVLFYGNILGINNRRIHIVRFWHAECVEYIESKTNIGNEYILPILL